MLPNDRVDGSLFPSVSMDQEGPFRGLSRCTRGSCRGTMIMKVVNALLMLMGMLVLGFDLLGPGHNLTLRPSSVRHRSWRLTHTGVK